MAHTISYILSAVSKLSPHYVHKPLPKPYVGTNIRAIFLGADPGTSNDQSFNYVFCLEDGEKSRYFRQFVPNLRAIGLTLDNLYVQNLCRNYFRRDTLSHKQDWLQCAALWRAQLSNELDNIDPTRTLPVLVSAFVILEALCIKECTRPEIYYANKILIRKNQNHLHRTVIPLFRGGRGKYLLTNPEWRDYARKIAQRVAQNFA